MFIRHQITDLGLIQFLTENIINKKWEKKGKIRYKKL